MYDNVLIVFAVIFMVVFALGSVAIFFFVYGEFKKFFENRNMDCVRGVKPHNWTNWYVKIINDDSDCLERHCKCCGTLETKTNHQLIQIGISKAECEERKMFCQDCGFYTTEPGRIPHDLEFDSGFSVNICMRCGEKVPLL